MIFLNLKFFPRLAFVFMQISFILGGGGGARLLFGLIMYY